MPPKKVIVEEVLGPWALGRFSTNLKVGVVGMPNVGKSTLYNCLTKCSIPAENFPFCTIEPNTTRVSVPDERFEWLVEQNKPKSIVRPHLEIVDIAGLVKGAADGAGLGNHFLSHIKAVDGIIHVMRAFEDTEVIHVEDRVDPIEDIEIISTELRIKDLEFMHNKLNQMKKDAPRASTPVMKKELEEELETVNKVVNWLEAGKEVRTGMHQWSTKDVYYLNHYSLITAKPVMYLINLTEKDFQRKKNKWLVKINDWVKSHGGGVMIPFSGATEQSILDMPADDADMWCSEMGITSVLPKIIKTAFSMVHLIYFFTSGPDEVRGWCIRKGYLAPQAAGVIHGDFERGFICAETMAFEDLKEHGTENAVKAAGKYRQEGKLYEVKDGDVIFFKFNVTAQKGNLKQVGHVAGTAHPIKEKPKATTKGKS